MTPTKKRDVMKFPPNVPVEVALKFALQGRIISTQSGERVMYTLADNRVMFLDLDVAKKVDELGVNVREKFFVCSAEDGKKGVEWSVWLSPETEAARAKAEAERNSQGEAVVEEETLLEKQLRQSLEMVAQGKLGELGNGMFAVPSGASAVTPAPVQSDAHNGQQTTNNRNGSTDATTAKNGIGPKNGKAAAAAKQTQTPVQPTWAEVLLGETDTLVDVYAAVLSRASTKHGNQVKPEDVRSLLVTVFIQRSKAVAYGA